MKYKLIGLLTLITMLSHAQQTNYHFSHTESSVASPNEIWNVWTDVSNWKQWDKGLKEASLTGEFKDGAIGKLIPDKGPQSKFIISDVILNQSYTLKTKIPFGWLIITRRMEVKEEKTFFTHEVRFTGVLKNVLGKKIGNNYRAMLPEVMMEIRKIAEGQQ